MARFYGQLQGSRNGEVTRTGTKDSGIWGHIRGWDVGIRVEGRPAIGDMDVFSVYLTSGSNGGKHDKLIGTFTAADLTSEG